MTDDSNRIDGVALRSRRNRFEIATRTGNQKIYPGKLARKMAKSVQNSEARAPKALQSY
jgi:hypothetical protein